MHHIDHTKRLTAIHNPLEALRFVAWSAFQKVADQIDREQREYMDRDEFIVAGKRTSPYRLQEEKYQFLIGMGLETADTLHKKIPPPPDASYEQQIVLKKHKDAFLRTFIRDDPQRLVDLVGHYDEDFPIIKGEERWLCREFLSTRPTVENMTEPPAWRKETRGEILSYALNKVEDEDYESNVESLNPDVVLFWISQRSPTVAGQLQEITLNSH